MRVNELMCKNVKFCSPQQTLGHAAQIMWDADCGCVPVVESNGEVVGMVTDRDICMAVHFTGRTPHDLRVSDAMTSEILTCRPDDQLMDVEEKMRRAQVRRLPVTDGSGHLVGILSLNDIAVEAERRQQQKSPGLTFDAIGLTLSAVCQPRNMSSQEPLHV